MPWWNPTSWFDGSAQTSSVPPSYPDLETPSTHGTTSPGSYEQESYETAPKDESLFSSLWGGLTDAKETAFDAASAAYDGFTSTVVEQTEKLERGFDQMYGAIEETYDDGISWLGERSDQILLELDQAKDEAVSTYQDFSDKAEQIVGTAIDIGELYVDHNLEQGKKLLEGTIAVHETALETVETIASTGYQVAQAAIETGDILLDVGNDEGSFSNNMIDYGIERLDQNFESSTGGQILSTAIDFAIWKSQVGDAVDFTVGSVVDQKLDGGSGAKDWAKQEITRVATDPNELSEFLTLGPVAYYASEKAQDLGSALAHGAANLSNTMSEIEAGTRQLTEEYVDWQMRGNTDLGALALTLVGDDDFVSVAEMEANLNHPGEPISALDSTLAKVLDTHGDPDDPNRALFVNGILNSEDRAVSISRNVYNHFGQSVTPIYNPSRSGIYDVAQTQFVNKTDLVDESTQLLIDSIRERLGDPERSEPLKLYPHSQGAALTSSALSHLDRAELAEIEVLSFGGAAYIYPQGLQSLEVLVNVRDVVPGLAGAGVPALEKSATYADSNYAVRYVDFGTAGDWADSHNVDGYLKELKNDRVYEDRWQATLARRLRGSGD